jgi:hypothetical protein
MSAAEKSKAELILADLRRCELKLGRFPTRDGYLDDPEAKFNKHDVVEVFGSWTKMLILEGIQYSKIGKRDKQELRGRYYENLLKEVDLFRSLPVIYRPATALLVIGDGHAPYMHQDYFEFCYALSREYNTDRSCWVGDEVDNHAISFHDKDPDLLSAGPELEAAIRQLEPFYKAFSRMDIAESNHGSLVYRKGKHHGLPRQVLKSYHEMLGAPPDWRWHFKIVVPLSNGTEVDIHHSYGANVLSQSKKRGRSLIQGHHHTEAGVQWWGNDIQEYFAAFSGCGIDDVKFAFAYNKNQVERPRLGALVVLNGIAHFKPMLLDKNNRWIGRVT